MVIVQFAVTDAVTERFDCAVVASAVLEAAPIANAESASPDGIAKHPTILAWPTKPGGEMAISVIPEPKGKQLAVDLDEFGVSGISRDIVSGVSHADR